MQKICSVCGFQKYYAKGFCRSCYRKQNQEGKKRWQKVKNNPVAHAKVLKAISDYGKRVRETDIFKEKRREYLRKHYRESKNYRQYLKDWKAKQPVSKKREWWRKDAANREFGAWETVEKIMAFYNYQCVGCGMSNEESKAKWKSRLSIHHKDGLGRATPREMKNNHPSNLIVMCKSCHQKEEKRLASLK